MLVIDGKNINCCVAMLFSAFGLHMGAPLAFGFVDQFTDILDDLIALLNVACGIHTAAMDRRASHLANLALGLFPHFFEFLNQLG
jgi:hypothetical protein